MQWKNVVIEILMVTAVSLVLVWSIGPGRGESLKSVERSFTEKLQAVESRVEGLEKSLADVRGSGNGTLQSTDNKSISQKLQKITERLANLEKGVGKPPVRLPSGAEMPSSPTDAALPPPPPHSGMGPARLPLGGDPLAWLSRLPDEKRSQVDELMKNHAMALRESLSALKREGDGAGGPPNPDAIRAVMEQNEQELKESMKSVLSPEDYQQFLNSLPRHKRPTPPVPN